jgi:hypothetical protein
VAVTLPPELRETDDKHVAIAEIELEREINKESRRE